MPRLLSLLVLISAPSWAIDYAIRLPGDTTTDSYAITDCNTTLTLNWVAVASLNVRSWNGAMKLWSTSGTCGDAPGANDVSYTDIPQTTYGISTTGSGDFTIKIAELPGFKVDGQACGTDNKSFNQYICGSIPYLQAGLTTQQTFQMSSLKMVYDRQPPTAPVLSKVESQDGALKVTYTVDTTDVTQVLAEYRAQGDSDFTQGSTDDASKGFTRITGLKNATTYDVRLRALDASGNQSQASDFLSGTPVRTYGFWGAYKDAGGTEQGCMAVPGELGAVAVGLWLARRISRRRRS